MKVIHSFTIIAAVILSGCAGYSALYQTDAPVRVGSIVVENPEKNIGERRIAQIITQELSRRFPNQAATDVLTITLERNIGALAVRDDATVERSQYTLTAKATITDNTGTTIWRDDLSISAAFSVEDNPLSTDIGQDYAAETAAITLADDVARHIYDVYRARNRLE